MPARRTGRSLRLGELEDIWYRMTSELGLDYTLILIQIPRDDASVRE